MTEIQSPTNSSHDQPKATNLRLVIRIRVAMVVIFAVACGWYAGIFQSMWTAFFPAACASGDTALFVVDFDAYPARMGDQTNLCTGVGDGECQRSEGDEFLHGECRSGQMHGFWSLKDVKTGASIWAGNYCNGLPCKAFQQRIDAEHANEFHVENLHIHGAATIWERQGDRFTEFSGRYERGKRTGRWVRRVEPSRAQLSVSIYDDHGFITSTSFYCTNGNRKEVRGQTTFFFDAKGNPLPDPSPCPLP